MAQLTPSEKKKVQKPLLWIGLASITMTFAGLTSGYVVSRSSLIADNRWLEFSLPPQFTWATYAMLISSLTMILAHRAAKRNNQNMLTGFLALTLGLGLAFVGLQYAGAENLLNRGLFFTGEKSNTAVSWVYVIAALHWLHVISGIIVLIYTLVKAGRGKYNAKNYQGLTVSAIYWHFLDALWLYLFLFLSFIR